MDRRRRFLIPDNETAAPFAQGSASLRGMIVPASPLRHALLGACFGFALALGGCASDPDPQENEKHIDLAAAAHQPLDDLNIDAKEIPPALVVARRAPYVAPVPASCEEIAAEILALDTVLGPDFDAPSDNKDATKKSRYAKANDLARSAAGGWIPFRSIVRWVTGADRHERDRMAAVMGGAARRGYLKGLRDDKACAPASVAATGESAK